MGDVFSTTCVVLKGDLPLTIHWTLNSEPITSGEDGFTVIKMNARTSYLSIESLEAKHRGIYRCIAVNVAGLAEHAAELQVHGGFSYQTPAHTNKHKFFDTKIFFYPVECLR